MQFRHAVLKGDSRSCIEAVNNRDAVMPWRLASFVADISLFFVNFNLLEFNWVYRNANKASHFMARWYLSNSFPGFFVGGLVP